MLLVTSSMIDWLCRQRSGPPYPYCHTLDQMLLPTVSRRLCRVKVGTVVGRNTQWWRHYATRSRDLNAWFPVTDIRLTRRVSVAGTSCSRNLVGTRAIGDENGWLNGVRWRTVGRYACDSYYQRMADVNGASIMAIINRRLLLLLLRKNMFKVT